MIKKEEAGGGGGMEENRSKRRTLEEADMICSEATFLSSPAAHGRAYCSVETQETQLKRKTQGTAVILNITNLAIVLDQG